MILFIWGKIRYDIIALLTLMISVILGIVPAQEAFIGFSHPTVITVVAVLIISSCLTRNGIADFIHHLINKFKPKFPLLLLFMCFICMLLSAFMNNIGALSLIIPIAISCASKLEQPPSAILIPLAFSSILGGLITLIGTPANMIIANFRLNTGAQPFGMFDFTPTGLCIAIPGVLFVSLLGWKLIPKTRAKVVNKNNDNVCQYITQISLQKDSTIKHKSYEQLLKIVALHEIKILSLVSNKQSIISTNVPIHYLLQQDDVLIIQGYTVDIDSFLANNNCTILDIADTGSDFANFPDQGEATADITSVIVTAQSSLLNRKIRDIMFYARYGVKLIGIYSHNIDYTKFLGKVTLSIGNILLLKGSSDCLNYVITNFGLAPLASQDIKLDGHKKLFECLAIFIMCIIFTIFKLLPPHISFVIGALAMVMFKLLPIKDLYQSIDFSTVVLLGAMIPIGLAFEKIGLANDIVNFITIFDNLPGYAILIIVMIITMLLTDIINNAATAIFMSPVAIALSYKFSLNPDCLLMAVVMGASCAFLTPIGHHNNALILSLGGYKFSDYWHVGLPLDIIILIIGIPSLLYFWPL